MPAIMFLKISKQGHYFTPLSLKEQQKKTASLLQYSWVMHISEGLQGTHANISSMLQIRGLIQSLLHRTKMMKGKICLTRTGHNMNTPASITKKYLFDVIHSIYLLHCRTLAILCNKGPRTTLKGWEKKFKKKIH